MFKKHSTQIIKTINCFLVGIYHPLTDNIQSFFYNLILIYYFYQNRSRRFRYYRLIVGHVTCASENVVVFQCHCPIGRWPEFLFTRKFADASSLPLSLVPQHFQCICRNSAYGFAENMLYLCGVFGNCWTMSAFTQNAKTTR